MNGNSKNHIISGVGALLFVILIIMLRTVNVAQIGPDGTSIGLSSINGAVFRLTGVSGGWYSFSEILGYLAILIAAGFAVLGAVQLIRRRSLMEVDREILSLGLLYAVTVVLYVVFTKVTVNYRPALMPGEQELEASFPSSHTMLACVIFISAAMIIGRYLKAAGACRIVRIVLWVLAGLTVAARLLSGAHWLTDILGGVLLSMVLLGVFAAVVSDREKNED